MAPIGPGAPDGCGGKPLITECNDGMKRLFHLFPPSKKKYVWPWPSDPTIEEEKESAMQGNHPGIFRIGS